MEMLREWQPTNRRRRARCGQRGRLRRDGFGDSRKFEALFAELGGRVVGFVSVFAIYSAGGKPA